MPTKKNFEDLLANCTVSSTTQGGKYGSLFTGKGDYSDNSVFFPAAGFCNSGSVGGTGNYGFYWSSTPDGSNIAYDLNFYLGNHQYVGNYARGIGFSVRAILHE